MSDQPVTIAEEVITSIVRQLIRRNVLDASDVEAMCDGVSAEAALSIRALFIEAQMPPGSEVRALKARDTFQIVGGSDGGN